MCGLLGQLGFATADPLLEARQLRRLVPLLARRGPDGEGFWADEERAALGFRRLAILDVSHQADQPMHTEDGRFVLVYNGEVYNFRELRKELEEKGVCFRSSGDTEVVLQSLALWGTEALSRFNGMFALACYDRRHQRMLLARDHAGIKPLYTLLGSRGLLFASQYDVLLAHPWVGRLAPSAEAIGLYLRLGYIPAPFAALRSTQMLEPGHWLEVASDGHTRRGRFFTFDWQGEPDLRGAEAYEAVQAAVTAAVRRQLVSDVPVGTYLSGGIDSPLVAATARAVADAPLPAFTLETGGDAHDESSDAAAYARELGAPHHLEPIRSEHARELLRDAVAACTEPFAYASLLPVLAVSRAARREVKVMLSGDGGDELFWGYTSRFAPILSRLAPAAAQGSSPGPLEKFLTAAPELRDAGWPASVGEIYRTKHTRGFEGWLRRLFPELPAWPSELTLFECAELQQDRVARWLRWSDFHGFLTNILLKMDRGSMAYGLEVRVPLLDREVVDVAARVDWHSCVDLGAKIGKLPLRQGLRRHVSHQTRAKRGFGFDNADWLAGPLAPELDRALRGRREIMGMRIDGKSLEDLLTRHRHGGREYAHILWVLMGLAVWEDHHWRGAQSATFAETRP